MIRRPLLALLAIAAVFSAGCLHLKKSPPKPSESLTGEVEADFKVRWVDKRAAELVAQGLAAGAAHAQATVEFKERYGFTGAAQK